jgi:hypothetical protein
MRAGKIQDMNLEVDSVTPKEYDNIVTKKDGE